MSESHSSIVPERPFRFFDNRQKYLAFVNTCNEKWKVAERATRELTHLRPEPPALRIFDAGVGDGTVLSHILRAMHQRYSTLPFYVGQQLRDLDEFLVDAWQATASPTTGNPLYVRPTVLTIYRKDHRFLLDSIIPRRGRAEADYDLVVASQPWRASMDADFKVKHVLGPLARALRAGGRLLAVQSCGNDVGMELIREVWPDENPFTVDRHELLKTLKSFLGHEAGDFNFNASTDEKAIFKYQMHTLPEEIAESIGTSTLFAAWNAATYVAQIEDQRIEQILGSTEYFEATARTLQKNGGMWFNDESFVVSRRGN